MKKDEKLLHDLDSIANFSWLINNILVILSFISVLATLYGMFYSHRLFKLGALIIFIILFLSLVWNYKMHSLCKQSYKTLNEYNERIYALSLQHSKLNLENDKLILVIQLIERQLYLMRDAAKPEQKEGIIRQYQETIHILQDSNFYKWSDYNENK